MTHSRVLETIRHADPGSRDMLNAIDAVNQAEWQGTGAAFVAEADAILARREATAARLLREY